MRTNRHTKVECIVWNIDSKEKTDHIAFNIRLFARKSNFSANNILIDNVYRCEM